MVFGAWLLLSCRAEDLGVRIPPKGRVGISQEDLKRDTWLAQENKGTHWYLQRMSQMGLHEFSDSLGVCVGSGKAKRIVVVENNNLASDVGMAIHISLAKAIHKSNVSLDFCIYTEPPQQQEFWLKNIAGEGFVYDKTQVSCFNTVTKMQDIDFSGLVLEVQNLAKFLGIP